MDFLKKNREPNLKWSRIEAENPVLAKLFCQGQGGAPAEGGGKATPQ